MHRLAYGFVALMLGEIPLLIALGLVRDFASPPVSAVLSVVIIIFVVAWLPAAGWVTYNALQRRFMLGQGTVGALLDALAEGRDRLGFPGATLRSRLGRRGAPASPDDPVDPR